MKKVYILFLIPSALLVWLLFFEKSATFSKQDEAPFQELRDIKITIDSKEGELWRVEASRAMIDVSDVVALYNVTFISEKDKVSLKAPQGRYEISTGDAVMSGGVMITLPDGSGRIDSLKIEKGNIKSPDPVIIERGSVKISGQGLVIDQSGNLMILRGVKVELR